MQYGIVLMLLIEMHIKSLYKPGLAISANSVNNFDMQLTINNSKNDDGKEKQVT
jgi:hypothetical protein